MTDTLPTLCTPEGTLPFSHSRPLALLCRLANADLPVRVVGDADIALVEVLAMGGSLKTATAVPVQTVHGHEQAATVVLEVTSLGRRLLDGFAGRRRRAGRARASLLAC